MQTKQAKWTEISTEAAAIRFSCASIFISSGSHTHRRSDRYKFDFFLSDFLQVISFCSCSTRQTMNLARCRNSWEHKFINPEFYLEFCVFLLSTAAMPHLVNCIGLTTTTIHTHTHTEKERVREREWRKEVSVLDKCAIKLSEFASYPIEAAKWAQFSRKTGCHCQAKYFASPQIHA